MAKARNQTLFATLFVSVLLIVCAQPETPAATVTPKATPAPSITAAPTPVPTSGTVKPTETPEATKTPTPSKTPEKEVTTPTATAIATAIATATATPTATPKTTLPPSPPPSPPPPPGAGSQKTAVLSVIKLTGSNLANFNEGLGSKFTAALSAILGVPDSSIIIRNWQTASSRRALLQTTDNVVVGSLASMGDGISAATGLAALKSADQSGALQAAFQKQGMSIEASSLQSADTVLPSNFQPLSAGQGSRGLKVWAWILIAITGVIVVASMLLCCCRNLVCCCCSPREEEERLPNMIKFGSQKDQTVPYFYSDQTFTKTPNLTSRQEIQPVQEV